MIIHIYLLKTHFSFLFFAWYCSLWFSITLFFAFSSQELFSWNFGLKGFSFGISPILKSSLKNLMAMPSPRTELGRPSAVCSQSKGIGNKNSIFIVIFTFVPGVFEFDFSKFQITICPKHRDEFSIGWRCRQMLCKSSPGSGKALAPHHIKKRRRKERTLSFAQSKLIYSLTMILVPVGSRKYSTLKWWWRFWTKLKYLVLYTLINSNNYVYSVPFRIIIDTFWRVHLSLASHKLI